MGTPDAHIHVGVKPEINAPKRRFGALILLHVETLFTEHSNSQRIKIIGPLCMTL